MFILGFIIGESPLLLVTAVQRPAAQLAVARARDLALVHHQIGGDDAWGQQLRVGLGALSRD
jgi:hypothetical protein